MAAPPSMGPPAWRGWPVALFLALAVAGLTRRDALEILRNATLLCLSCMGLGQ